MIFLVLSGKIIVLFPENTISHLRRKMKDDLSQKNTRKYEILKDDLFKKGCTRTWSSCIIWKDGIFSGKHDIFSLGRKWKMTFLKKYIEIYYFLCIRTCVTNVVSRSFAKKSIRWSYLTKIHLKVIDILGWHPRKSSRNSLYFHGDLYRHFHVLLSSEKKPRNLIYRTEVWLLLQFIRLEIFYNE